MLESKSFITNDDTIRSRSWIQLNSKITFLSLISVNRDISDLLKFAILFELVILKDTLEYKMADSKGMLLGNRLLNTFENKLWHKKSMIFEKGKYTVSIQHAMRKINQINGLKSLGGIINIGYRIEKETEK